MSPVSLKSKSKERIEFFELLFGSDSDEGGYLCIASTDPIAPKTSFNQRFFTWPDESIAVENYILKNEINKNLYFCINLLSKMERKKKNCLSTNILWADLDEVDPAGISNIPPPIIVQSSPARWQAFWRLTTKLKSFDAEQYSRRIAYALGADASGWDLTQLFRIPFTRNFKYPSNPQVVLERAMETKAEVILFEVLAKPAEQQEDSIEIPEVDSTAEEIISKYTGKMDAAMFITLYISEPGDDQDWSRLLWHLIHLCFKAGMNKEEVFVIAQTSACNKYARDGRPISHLWKDVLKASIDYATFSVQRQPLVLPELANERVGGESFIDKYVSWATETTDAVPEYHELSAFILLSTIVSSSVRLKFGFGDFAPNIWGMILGDSTITRKTTSMRMAMELLATLDDSIHMASDASPEGLISGLSNRPNKVSLFFRDELSGMFESMSRKEYMGSMMEILCGVYESPQVYTRMLKKETIKIERPIFVFFGGGVTQRVYSVVDEEWITSGFIPRFLVVAGEGDMDMWADAPLFSSTNSIKRNGVLEILADLYENYAQEVTGKIGGQSFTHAPKIEAIPTPEAWETFNKFLRKLVKQAHESNYKDVALPTFDRLGWSLLKLAMILAATEQIPKDESILIKESNIIDAASYIQRWGRHSVHLILNSGRTPNEKKFHSVLIKIKENPGISRGILMQHQHLSKKEAEEVLGTLEERGQIRGEKQGRGFRYWAV